MSDQEDHGDLVPRNSDGPMVRGDGAGSRVVPLQSVQQLQMLSSGQAGGPDDGGDRDEIDLLAYWRMLVKRRWIVVGVFLVVVLIGLVRTLLATPVYRATSVLQIDRSSVEVVQVEGITSNSGRYDYDFYQTQYELLQSRSLAERVAQDLNLADSARLAALAPDSPWERLRDLVLGSSKRDAKTDQAIADDDAEPSLEQNDPEQLARAAAGLVRGGLQVEPVQDSALVRLHFNSYDGALAVRAANAFADAFQASNLERKFEASSYAREYLEDRLEELKLKLQDSERTLVEFAQKEQIIRPSEGGASMSEMDMTSLNAALASARAERIKAEARWRQAQSSNAAIIHFFAGENSIIASLQGSRGALMAEYQEKLRTFKPAYPDMQQLKAQIDELDRQVADEVGAIKASVKGEFESAQAQESMLATSMGSAKDEVLDLQSRSIDYNILKREVDTNRELYDGLLQRYKEIGVAGGVSSNNISIVDRADQAWHFSPNLSRSLMMAAAIGLILGILLALLIEFLDDTIKAPDEVESRLGLANIGVIPRLPKNLTIALAQADPRSAFAEAYRSARTALQFTTDHGIPSTLLVTSTSPGEGKSTTALALARNIAQLGKQVLLIDADLRNPSLHKTVEIDNVRGLSSCLSGADKPGACIRKLPGESIFVMTSGPIPPNPAELLTGSRLVSLLSQATERYAQVIIDAPPVLGLADAPILANIAEGTVLVVEAGKTRISAANAAIKRLRGARGHLLGAILTKFDARRMGYGYGYGDRYAYLSYDYQAYGASDTKQIVSGQ